MKSQKSKAVAFLLWFFLGGIGTHRVYVQDKMSVLLWYWLATIFTLGIWVIIDLFLISGMVDKRNAEIESHYYRMQRQ